MAQYLRHFLEDPLGYPVDLGITDIRNGSEDLSVGGFVYIGDDEHSVLAPGGTGADNSVGAGHARVLGQYGVGLPRRVGLGLAAVDADADNDDVEVLTTVYVDSTVTTWRAFLGARVSGTSSLALTGYFGEVSWNDATSQPTAHITKCVAGTDTALASSAALATNSAGIVHMRFRVNGTALKLRVWQLGEVEPSAWTVEVTDAAVAGTGRAGGGVFMTTVVANKNLVFPYLSMATGGDTAPDGPVTWPDYLDFLGQQDSMRCVLVEVEALGQTSVGAEAEALVCMSNYPFVGQPWDTYPNVAYEEILLDIGAYSRRMTETLVGRSTISHGDIVFANEVSTGELGFLEDASVGQLDDWTTWNWNGRAVRVLYGSPAWRRCDFKTIQLATVQDIYRPARGRLGFKLRGQEALFQRPFQTELIGGTSPTANALMPRGKGTLFNIEPPWYDTTTLDLQVVSAADAAAALPYSVEDGGDIVVKDSGLSLNQAVRTVTAVDTATDIITFDAPHGLIVGATIIFEPVGPAWAPTPLSHYIQYYVVSIPTTSSVTVSATSGGAAVNLTAATTGALAYGRLFSHSHTTGRIRLLSTPAGVVTVDINHGSSVTDTLTLATWVLGSGVFTSAAYIPTVELGLWLDGKSQPSIGELLERILLSSGAFCTHLRSGYMHLGQLNIPAAPSDWTLGEDDVLGLAPKVRLLPAEVQRLGYAKNYTVQKTGLLGAVTLPDREELGRPYTIAVYTPSETGLDQPANNILRRSPPERETLFSAGADAQDESERIYNIYRTVCETFTFRVDATGLAMELGEVVHLTHSRHGFDAGRYGVIVGLVDHPLRGQVEVEIFVQTAGDWPVVTATNPVVSEAYY
jgi:hypothetical protein